MGELPIDYTPLSQSDLEVGMEFGPVNFVIKPHSHEKSKKLLEKSDLDSQAKIISPYLLPSEMWGMARVFSSYFGRLNEIAVSRTKWQIYGTAKPNEELTAQSKVVSLDSKRGLSFATAETTTVNKAGKLLLRCMDELILLHGINTPFYQERREEAEIPSNPTYQKTRRVCFRHVWDNGKWINNIHTDKFAQQFGYERGLPEFIMYMDWIFLSQLERRGEKSYHNTTIDILKILPVYKGDIVKVTATEGVQHSMVQFFRGNQKRLEAMVLKGT